MVVRYFGVERVCFLFEHQPRKPKKKLYLSFSFFLLPHPFDLGFCLSIIFFFIINIEPDVFPRWRLDSCYCRSCWHNWRLSLLFSRVCTSDLGAITNTFGGRYIPIYNMVSQPQTKLLSNLSCNAMRRRRKIVVLSGFYLNRMSHNAHVAY